MKGDIYLTTFQVVTVKEDGKWKVKDTRVLDEKKS
jgi:hypothetical protein